MPLADELTATVAHVRGALPQQVFDDIARSILDLQETQIAERATGVGARPALPSLPDAAGRLFDLAAQSTRGPLVLVFYRGGWCPYCNVSLRALQKTLPEIRAAGGELVAVTPELPERIGATGERVDAGFPILHDAHNAFARSLGLVFVLPEELRRRYTQIGIELPEYNGDGTFTLPIPATYVIGRDGVVGWAFLDADFTLRAEPESILRVVRSLSLVEQRGTGQQAA